MSPRDQILQTAARLFFSQGYTQTGIAELIAESGVARRTFYHHFSSKEALADAYLEYAASEWLGALAGAMRSRRTASGVSRALFAYLEEVAQATDFRGCGLLNLAAEFADPTGSVRVGVQRFKEAQRQLLRSELARVGATPSLGDSLHVLLEGAVAGAAAHRDTWPIRAASAAAAALIGSSNEEEHR